MEKTNEMIKDTTVKAETKVETNVENKPVNKKKSGSKSANSKSDKKVDKPVAKKQATEEQFHTYKLDLNKCELKNTVFNFKLSNVKDFTYFKRGLVYFNYCAMLVQVENERTNVSELRKNLDVLEEKVASYLAGTLKDVEESELAIIQQYVAYTSRINDLNDLHAKISGMKDQLKFKDEECEEFKRDNFMKLTGSVLFRLEDECPLKGLSEVFDKLKTYATVAYDGQFNPKTKAAFTALKEQLQSMASEYDTVDDERYGNSKLNVNSTMTQQVFQFYYRGCRIDKTGNFVTGNKTEKQLRSEIIAQFTGRLQGSISNDVK